MSNTTPNELRLPFPDPVDPVRDGATAIRLLAEALEARWSPAYADIPIGAMSPAVPLGWDDVPQGQPDPFLNFPDAGTLADFQLEDSRTTLRYTGPSPRAFHIYVNARGTGSTDPAEQLGGAYPQSFSLSLERNNVEQLAYHTAPIYSSGDFVIDAAAVALLYPQDTLKVAARCYGYKATANSSQLRVEPVGPVRPGLNP